MLKVPILTPPPPNIKKTFLLTFMHSYFWKPVVIRFWMYCFFNLIIRQWVIVTQCSVSGFDTQAGKLMSKEDKYIDFINENLQTILYITMSTDLYFAPPPYI